MRKEVHKCMTCDRIIGVNIIPGKASGDTIVTELECIDCYNKQDWTNVK